MRSGEVKSTKISKVKKALVYSLKNMADPGLARSSQRFFPERITCYGIRAENLRRLTQELYQQVKADWTEKEALRLVENLLQEKELESRLVGLIFLGYFKDRLKAGHLENLASWLKKGRLDNWALIDTFSLEVLSPFLLENPIHLKKIAAWIEDKNTYLKRAGLVALIKPARKKQHLSFIFSMANRAVSGAEVDDLVAKAGGWLLREAGRYEPKSLESFLRRYGKKWPRLTVRYALEKFPPDKRKRLLQITKNN
ncbi:MAG: DNA alkylation repair protein [Candidatus Saccharicenans sp.]|jgi:3-methyladenine DNA glycosylase AlkD|nr:DNA alkylation repair protein [Candidatus Saccharicenans sp.]MDH7492524.1 DNA alkylation repair protein [Candidatus Saccharicenans sp.]